jgi:hypothetical protein
LWPFFPVYPGWLRVKPLMEYMDTDLFVKEKIGLACLCFRRFL